MSNTRPSQGTDDENTYELGDLELAPRRPSLSQPGQTPIEEDSLLGPLPTLGGHAPVNDISWELERGNEIARALPSGVLPGVPMDHRFDDSIEGPDLELDVEAPKPGPVRASMPKPISDHPSLRPSTPSSRAPRTPSGRPLDEERRARELADYGQAEGGIDPARYVIHVGLRMFALWRERGPIEQRAGELADVYELALRELGEALLADQAVLAHEGLAERILLVKTRQGELEKTQADTQQALEKERSTVDQYEQEEAKLKAELAPFEEAERQADAVRAKADAALKRQRAKLQRAEIELRALSKASMPPPPERVQSIESERASQQRELDGLEAALNEANGALGRARRELALRTGALSELQRKKQQQENATRAHVRGHEASVARAEHALSAVLVSLAEAADAVGLAKGAHQQVLKLRESERALDEVVDQLARYDRALRMYDREAMVQGGAMWLGVLIAFALLVYLL